MAFVNKLISTVNQASSAVKTAKGIKSKLTKLNGQSTSFVDELREQAAEAERVLEQRRTSLEKNLSATNNSTKKAKEIAQTSVFELQYPLNDDYENFIVFRTRPRKNRATNEGSGNGRNLLSNESVEIALYVPDTLTSTAAVGYKAEGVGAFVRGAVATADAEGFMGTMSQLGSEISNVVGGMVNKAINAVTGDAQNFISGQAVNPMQEQMLDGVNFRSFSFEYDFWPKSPDEAKVVNQIIYYFRTAMLPDTFGSSENSKAESFFNYPNVFDVELEGPVSETIDGFLPMVCTQCDVQHFGGGTPNTTFYDGNPVHTTMTLQFLEIKILSQESYQQIAAGKKNSKFANSDIGAGQESLLDNNTGG